MFPKTTTTDWENLVKKQLKTEDIYPILTKENIENIDIKPYYDGVNKPLSLLPKIEESTVLVAPFHPDFLEESYAFLVKDKIEETEDKTLYYNNIDAVTLSVNKQNIALIDVFKEDHFTIDQDLANKLLTKDFKRNLTIDIALHQNAGASMVQQLGLALAKTKELIEVFGKDIFPKLTFKIAIGNQYFLEMAKVRALKLIINQLSKEYGLDEIPYIFAETSLRNKTKTDPENNLIRSTLELASAMISGTDAVFTNDYKLENSNLLSEEISFKQQIVLAYESLLNVFEDASNGSYFVEDLTQQFAEKSWAYFLEIEEHGGYLENLKNGKIQKDIFLQATKEQSWLEDGKIKLIGVNLYPKLEVKKSIQDLYTDTKITPVRLAEMFE